MGIVVSSRQASNIFWHSMTRLNAICVLISSLQQPWPLEKRGVRWFSLFHSPAQSSSLSLVLFYSPSLIQTIQFYSFFFSHSVSFGLSCFTIYCSWITVSREDSLYQTKEVSIVFCALVCHLVSSHRPIHSQTERVTTCSSVLFCPSAWGLRCTTCQPAVFLRGKK